METVSVVLFLLSAFTPPVQSQLTSLHYILGDMNQIEARKACREKYTDLVTVYSDEDNTKLYNIWIPAWIGLYRSNFSEKWSNGDNVTYRNLTGDCGTSSYCVVMKPDGSWESLNCTDTRYFMCYEQDASSQTRNYHLILETKTWYEAQRYCRQRYTDLVSIRDQQHNDEVMIKGLNSSTPFWTGLLCDDWQWIDGGISAYRNWAWQSGEPYPSPYNCVVHYIWGWDTVQCNNHYSAFCYSTSTPPVQNQLTSLPGRMNQTDARKACRENYTDLVTVYSDEDNTELADLMIKAHIYIAWIGLYRNASSQTRNYHLILESKTWYKAQRYCRQRYTDLVSIRDQQHNEEVRIKGLNSTIPFWIGLLCDDWQWIDGGISAYRNWGWQSGEPNPSPYNCVVHNIWGWYSVPCDYPYSALCYNNYIHVSEEALSWEKALDYCDKGNRAGILIIDSQAEQEQLETELMRRRVPPGSLWVGLGPKRLSELKVSSGPLTCEDIQRQSGADTHTAGAAPDYVMDTTELRVVCKLK